MFAAPSNWIVGPESNAGLSYVESMRSPSKKDMRGQEWGVCARSQQRRDGDGVLIATGSRAQIRCQVAIGRYVLPACQCGKAKPVQYSCARGSRSAVNRYHMRNVRPNFNIHTELQLGKISRWMTPALASPRSWIFYREGMVAERMSHIRSEARTLELKLRARALAFGNRKSACPWATLQKHSIDGREEPFRCIGRQREDRHAAAGVSPSGAPTEEMLDASIAKNRKS